jgi:hypothetical protein
MENSNNESFNIISTQSVLTLAQIGYSITSTQL